MFVNKERYLIETMIKRKITGRKKDTLGQYYILPQIFKYEFEFYVLRLTVSTYDITVNYIKEDNLYKKSDSLPDSDEYGNMLLYYNIDEVIKILKEEVEKLNKK